MKPMISTLFAAGAVTLASLSALPGPSAAAAQTETCRGLPVTHVGSPAEPLRTGDGDDVVLTNDAQWVRTGLGDDVVCVTGSLPLEVLPGAGDDVIDASAYAGSEIYATFVGTSGDADEYLGGTQHDHVTVTGRETGGTTFALTAGAGNDNLYVTPVFAGDVVAELGDGYDVAWFSTASAGAEIDGGEGTDRLVAQCSDCPLLAVNLQEGTHYLAGEHGAAPGFENLSVSGLPGEGGPPKVVLVGGTERRNHIGVDGCRVEVDAAGGSDRVRHGALPDDSACAEGRRYRLDGGAGNDTLRATAGDDALLGGPGYDKLNGREGTDRCRGEVERQCER